MAKITRKLQSRISSQTDKLAGQLAKAAKIDLDAAIRVLDVLQVDRLMDQMNTIEQLSSDKKAMEALNIHKSHIGTYRQEFTIEKLSLVNLRLGVLSTRLSGQSIVV